MHRLLERQLRRYLGKDFQPDARLLSFLEIIDNYYHDVDKEQRLLQNALLMSTTELNAVNDRMRIQNAETTRILLNTLSDGVYATDLEGRLTFMNATAEKLLGWQEKELIGRPVHEIVQHHFPDGSLFPAEISPQLSVIRNGESIDGSGHYLNRDRKFFPIDYLARPIIVGGKLTGALVSFHDITERKKNEEKLRQAKNVAEQANKVKGQFLANMSHEIRTPMNGIIGMTELALGTELNHEQRECLSLVKSSASELMHIINDILDFSKIESGKMNIEIVEFSLEQLLRDMMKSFAVPAHQKNLTLLLNVASDVPHRVFGDPGRLRQVIVNLVGNAIKFTESGEIEVAVQRLNNVREKHANLRFNVRDTGIGIPRDKFKTIFKSFSQADSTTTRKYGGTGLGLTISTQLIRLMGGKIGLESKLGKGSSNCVRSTSITAFSIVLMHWRISSK